ncbi:MAG: tryptophan 7-halogenase [Alphaproteobacteria bacterium]|nr:MAG: tryptophan 7-halogenase [Alphaproteobacteria bacterium]
MATPLRSVVIVGGGTAGWMVACRLAAKHRGKGENGLQVVLIESPNIATVGVGEGTWPTMRASLRKIGLSETVFLRECDAAFKQGGKFARWTTGADDDFYYHPFGPPVGHGKITLAPYWAKMLAPRGIRFAEAVDMQHHICEKGLAPKTMASAEYEHVANYAYHLDAGKFASLLQRHAVEALGVRHIRDDVTAVRLGDDGAVAALETAASGVLAGDLYVDCSGFSALVLGKTLGVPFIDRNDVLFADRAMVAQMPHATPDAPLACQTNATAHQAGWTWDIALPTRRGIGHVYSSAHMTDEEAERGLRAYLGPEGKDLPLRTIAFRSGHRQRFWEKNCVAVGLSAGFLEPLEASALLLVEMSADMIADQLPACLEVMPAIAAQFNRLFAYRWDRIIDFLKLHYMLSKREDHDFWIDNRRPESIPDGLAERLSVWRYHPPSDYDFTGNNEVFSWASYHYVMYGMDFPIDYRMIDRSLHEGKLAQRFFAANARATRQALADLPMHRDLLCRLERHAFQPI